MIDVKAACAKWAEIRGHYPNPGPQFEAHMGQFLEWVQMQADDVVAVSGELDAPHTEADRIAHKAVAMLREQGIAGTTVHTAVRSVVAFTMAELAQRQSMPVKVRFDVTADGFNSHFSQIDRGLFEPDVIPIICDYLAQHAVIDAPAGVPSVEELAEIARKVYYPELPDWSNVDLGSRVRWTKICTAIRDAILASLPRRPMPTREEVARAINITATHDPSLFGEWYGEADADVEGE